MIGVIAAEAERASVQEFFELFKTPWEFCRQGRRYEVVLSTGERHAPDPAPAQGTLIVCYGGRETEWDRHSPVRVGRSLDTATLSYQDRRLPLYGAAVTFEDGGTKLLTLEDSGERIAYMDRVGDRTIVRIGYDLFAEVRWLLSDGQPAVHSSIPTLELHVALLRNVITGSGLPLVEIPPAPAGYPFIACLTHDVDHPSIRRHVCDRTMFGFVYRATVGSVIRLAQSRLPVRKVLRNWAAVVKLPLVYLGIAADSWRNLDRYLEIEGGRPSTFFVIPFAGDPGRAPRGIVSRARASGYGVAHIADKIRLLAAAGCEIGLHGIDAWGDRARGVEEAREVAETTDSKPLGVRMHWLFHDEATPVELENAGFSYDSTVGYNETVGYRAGTGQVFKPLNAERLLELPMHVMDTALFYPNYLDLSEGQAWARLTPIIAHAVRDGGVVTVNWHDRSIAPERLWDDFYRRILDGLTSEGAWFATSYQAVEWFSGRRSVVFDRGRNDRELSARSADYGDELPDLRLRVYPGHAPVDASDFGKADSEGWTDTAFRGTIDISLSGPRLSGVSCT